MICKCLIKCRFWLTALQDDLCFNYEYLIPAEAQMCIDSVIRNYFPETIKLIGLCYNVVHFDYCAEPLIADKFFLAITPYLDKRYM